MYWGILNGLGITVMAVIGVFVLYRAHGRMERKLRAKNGEGA